MYRKNIHHDLVLENKLIVSGSCNVWTGVFALGLRRKKNRLVFKWRSNSSYLAVGVTGNSLVSKVSYAAEVIKVNTWKNKRKRIRDRQSFIRKWCEWHLGGLPFQFRRIRQFYWCPCGLFLQWGAHCCMWGVREASCVLRWGLATEVWHLWHRAVEGQGWVTECGKDTCKGMRRVRDK